ncbi:MAG: GNAT family N-acetyltransferase [Tissierellia bacterium]|nr:GNAT family N-acetyltransferase [Tissierellia bacterium]
MISIRKFKESDIENKVKWINDEENNQYLHYELPLDVEKTRNWFKNKNDSKRYDAVIEYEGIPVGLIGLLDIKDGKAEYYVIIGDKKFKKKGIGIEATKLIIEYGKNVLKLNSVIGYTETGNENMINLFLKSGFEEVELIKNSAKNRDRIVDRYFFEYKF